MLESVDDNNDLLSRMAGLITKTVSGCGTQLKGAERWGKTLVFFMPGQPTSNGLVYCLDDLKTKNRQSIPPLNMNPMPQLLNQALPEFPLSHIHKIILINDMAGGLAASLAQLAKLHPEKFQPGMEAVYLMCGGGLGVADASYTQDRRTLGEVRIALTETSSLPCFPKSNPTPANHSEPEWGGHVDTLLSDFTKALPERLQSYNLDIKNSHNGKIVTSFAEARKAIPTITLLEYKKAAKEATDRYINTLAYIAAMRICSGTNLAILAGPLTNGVKNFVTQNSDMFSEDLTAATNIPINNATKLDNTQKFDKVFLSRVWYQLNQVGQDLFKNNGFEVVSDLPVADNNEGTPYIAQGWFANRNDRYVIPAEVIRHG